VREAARYLGVSADTIAGLVARGALRRRYLPGVRRLLLERADLDRLADTA
jgi:excisionase family DNA binding protein